MFWKIFAYIFICGFVIFMVVCLIYNRNVRNKLLDEGKIIIRKKGFWDMSETFTIRKVTLQAIYNRISADDMKKYMGQYELHDGKYILFQHTGVNESFKATLRLVSSEDDLNTYRLQVDEYTTNSSYPNEQSLNVVFTAVERIFLSYDPNIQVVTAPIARKTTRG